MNQLVTDYINEAPEAQKEIMELIRSLIHKNVKNATEDFKWSRPIFKTKKDFAYLQANKNHVNLGFYQGFLKLNDPENILEGTGKTMRHIKIKTTAQINTVQLGKWLKLLGKDAEE